MERLRKRRTCYHVSKTYGPIQISQIQKVQYLVLECSSKAPTWQFGRRESSKDAGLIESSDDYWRATEGYVDFAKSTPFVLRDYARLSLTLSLWFFPFFDFCMPGLGYKSLVSRHLANENLLNMLCTNDMYANPAVEVKGYFDAK